MGIFTSVINWVVNPTNDATILAQILGVWTAARAAVSTVAGGIASAAVQTTINNALAKYQDVPLSGAALADMIVRNVLPDSTGRLQAPTGFPAAQMPNGVNGGTATAEASLTGISGDRFTAMVLDTGESYGILDALRLYNRGGYLTALSQTGTGTPTSPLYSTGASLQATYGITQAELYNVIAYSRVRPEFTPDLLKLALNTISPADAVEMAVKSVVSTAEAQDLYAAAGGIPEQFQALVDSAGDSAGLEHATELLQHGAITATQMQQIMGMSRLNPRFYYLYEQGADGRTMMGLKWLPPDVLARQVEMNLMTQEAAITYMVQSGYSTADATNYMNAVQLSKVVHIRGATEAQIAADWEAGLITNAQATTALENLGYQSWAIPIILDTYEARKVIAARNNVVSRARASLLVGGVTTAEAVADLVSVGFSSPAAQEMAADWTVEANTPTKVIPYNIVGSLLKQGIMGSTDGINYFRRSGYTQQDAEMMTEFYAGEAVTSPAVVAGAPGPVEEEEPTPIPPPPTRTDITELGPTRPAPA